MGSTKKYYREALKDWPENDRPKEKFVAHGGAYLSDSELLAILVESGSGGKNSVDLARDLLKKFDDLSGIDSASIDELCKVNGIGNGKAIIIKAGLEIGRRFVSSSKSANSVYRSSEDVVDVYMPKMKNLKREIFKIVLLNAKNKPIKSVTIAEGGLTSSVAHPREIFNPAIRESAHAVILMHNHPTGDPEPSDEDINYTRRLVEAGKMVGIKVLDHIIIGENNYYSFSDEGNL